MTYHKNRLKIRNFNIELFEEFEKRLRIVCKSLGIVSAPTAEDMAEKMKFLINEFSDFSMDEVIFAFEKASSGFLNSPENPNISAHFQSFDNIYIGKILSAYRSFREGEIKKFENTQKPEEIILTEQEKEKILIEGLFSCFQSFKTTNVVQDIGSVNYNLLDRLKIVSYTNDKKNEFLEKAKEKMRIEIIGENDFSLKKNISESLKKINSGNSEVISFAKKLALKEFFQNLIDTDTDLGDLIKKKVVIMD